MALSGHTEMICFLSAFGAKRTSREAAACFSPAQLTHSVVWRANFAVTHNAALDRLRLPVGVVR
jgi:hypothetical protein